jgi:hypothetical protein
LADGLLALRKYPPACVMFTEFGRLLFRFNGYQPPARTVHDIQKVLLDTKGEVNYYDELLESALQFIESETPQVELLDEPADKASSPESGKGHAVAEFICSRCDGVYELKLNSPEMMQGCPHCASSKAEDID